MPRAERLHIEHYGAGPPLVLAHGFGGSARNFRPQARALSQSAQVWLYDCRGHARSFAPAAASAYTLDELVGDFELVLDQACGAAEQSVAIAGGLSLGAYTALNFALKRPERVFGLLLSAFPSAGGPTARGAWARDFARAIEARGLEAAGADFVWGETSRFDPKGAALIRQGFLEHDPLALAAILRNALADLPEVDALGEKLQKLRMPVAIVVGAEDRESLEPSRRLAAMLPNAELTIVANAGHVVNLAAPEPFNQALTRLLERANAARSQ